ncbi:hypothetical protein N1F78_08130 [Seonamhaeicola sp. MEBiC1930]|uniref:hypothetical protein n=1 Tax=Seonamhaeicola sp. MEBiC01930 TaxID=2976768 RepID=UPI0032494E88
MKYPLVFLLMLLLASCNYFDVKKTSSEAILNEELKTFNWKEVDVYPSFSMCDSLSEKHEKMYCFQYFIKKQIIESLEQEVIVVTQDINDTIQLKFQITEAGALNLLETEMDSLTIEEIPNIEDLIVKSLDSLPEIYPAIKRGQQVKTQFNLPIAINVE